MRQAWIIDGEWSQYHDMTARRKGWHLTQRDGMWQITTADTEKFLTDDDARLHVLAAESDPDHEQFTLAMIAINAIMVGNVRG